MTFDQACESYPSNGAGFAAAVVEGGNLQTQYQNCDQNGRFEIGSITKVFTAILLCDAIQSGLCDLDDPVEIHLPPSLRVPTYFGRKITLRHLATHTSGLPRLPTGMYGKDIRSAQPYARWDRDRLIKGLSQTMLFRRPGSMYSYSNFGFAVLGAVLEFIHDESYGTLLQKLTLRLGCPGIRLPSGKDQEVAGYGAKGAPVQPWKFDVFAPVGAATATLPDLISFVQRCMAPIEEPGLIETMSERMTFSTRPPFGSGLPQTAVGASTAAIATIVSPQSYYVPLYACGVAALFGGGASGGLIATAAWTAASIYNRAPIDVVGQRIGFGLLATGIAVLSTSAKRKRTMGLGWHVTQLDTRDIIWHNGGTAGFRSFLGIDSERGKASIVLSARAQSVDAVGLSLLR